MHYIGNLANFDKRQYSVHTILLLRIRSITNIDQLIFIIIITEFAYFITMYVHNRSVREH